MAPDNAMGNPGKKAVTTVKSTRTTFLVIDSIRRLDNPGVTDIANELNLSKSSIHNYLSTLVEEEYIIKRGNTYQIGLQFLRLGSCARHDRRIYRNSKEEVSKLSEKTGEVASLLVEEYGKGVYLHRQSGEQAVRVDSHPGHRVYLHNTALGKAILSELPQDYVEKVVDKHGLPSETENGISEREELFEELSEISEKEVAFDMEERLKGLRCVATPIIDVDGHPLGAISISGPVSRMRGKRFETEIPQLLLDTRNIIELNCTHSY